MKTAEKLTKPQSPCTVFYHTLYTYEKTRRAVKCAVCGADMPSQRRKYCSDSCRKKGERIKAGKAAVKTDSFAEYEKACVEAMKRGEWLTYGRFMAQKMTEGEAE